MAETPTLEMLAAVDFTIQSVRAIHPDIPPVTVVLGAPGHLKTRQVHGHFAPNRWSTTGEDKALHHEVSLSGESLERGAVSTFGTIVHELAHAHCHATGVKDTSDRGRYHNHHFKECAEEFGLAIGYDKRIGHSPTEVPAATQEQYAEQISALEKALTLYRVTDIDLAASADEGKWMMWCPECDDKITVTKKWFERNEHLLVCQGHGCSFVMEKVFNNGEGN